MLPTTQMPVLRPTPTLSGMNGRPSSFASCSRSWLSSSTRSSMSSAASQALSSMVLVVERRVPERHDGVAHVFVDGALAIEDGVGQRRQEAIHQRGEALRIVLVGFRDRGEAAHVGEHDGHLALLAAEHELFRRLRELLDQRRRQYWPKAERICRRCCLLAHEAREDQRQIDRRGRHQGIGEIDQQPVLGVEICQDVPISAVANAAPTATSVIGPNIGANAITSSPNSSAVANSTAMP